jgi:tetratricopeptide (TPR) repeat protein
MLGDVGGHAGVGTDAAGIPSEAVLELRARLCLLLAEIEMEQPVTEAAQSGAAVTAAGTAPQVARLIACAFGDWAVLLGPCGGRSRALASVSAAAGDLLRISKLCWGMVAGEEAMAAAAMAVGMAAGRGSANEQAARAWHAFLLQQTRAPAGEVEAALGQVGAAPPAATALRAVWHAEAVLAGERGSEAQGSLPSIDAELQAALRDCPPADSLLRSQLRRTIARVALAAGARAAALRHAEMALKLAKQPQQASVDAHDNLVCTRDALMVLAEAWRARGSYADAHKYLTSACLLADRSGVWRLILDTRLAVLSLQTDAMRFQEADAAELGVRQAMVGMQEAQASLLQTLTAAGQAEHSATFAAGRHQCNGDVLEARYELVRTDLMLARGLASEAAVAAEAGLRLVATHCGQQSPGCASEGPAVGARGPQGGASESKAACTRGGLLELAFWSRAAEAALQARDWTRARECADRAVAQAEGARGLLFASPPILRGDTEAARALVVSAEARLPPFDAPGAGKADAARSELEHALRLCEGGAPPALVRRACLALAALCIGVDSGYGALVLAGASGVALRNQLVLVDEGRSRGSGEGDGGSCVTTDGESGRSSGDDDGAGSLAAALGSLSLGVERPFSQSSQLAPPTCPAGVGRWIEAPPDGATVCTIALAPDGRGLLLASWRSGREPLVMRTGGGAVQSGGEQGDELGGESSGCEGVEAMLAELTAILSEGRSANASGQQGAHAKAEQSGSAGQPSVGVAEASGQREHPSSPEQLRLHPDSPASSWPRAELIPDSGELSVVILGRAHPTATLGRGQCGACFIDLDQVSSEHCSLSLDASGRLMLTDLSTNGTFVDGSRPSKRDGRTCELRDGSRVTLVGKTARECAERFGELAPSYVARICNGGGKPTKAPAQPRGASAVATASASRVAGAGGARSAVAAPPGSSAGADDSHAREQLDRSLYWAKREELDNRLGALAARMQERLLGPMGAALLLPLPSEGAARAAAEGLGQALVDQAAKLRWRCDAGVLRAMGEASPWLEAGELRAALSDCARGPTGKPLAPSALVAAESLLRTRWRAAGLSDGSAGSSASNGAGSSAQGTSRAAAGPGVVGMAVGVGARSSIGDGAAGEGRSPLILILDEVLSSLPWESMPCLSDLPVCRLPCAALLGRCAEAARERGGAASADSVFYVLNPSGDLIRTQSTLEPTFARPPWEGVAGQSPTREALYAALEHKDLFVYCGHGDGSKYVSADRLQRLPRCSVAMLMGCSSGALRRLGGLAPSGMPLSYLHGRAPAVVANLWDVTDGEIDRYSQALVDMCERGVPLLLAAARARRACRLRFLTGAAAVCYGAPIEVRPRTVV